MSNSAAISSSSTPPKTFPKAEKIASPLQVAQLSKTGRWTSGRVLKACWKKVEPGCGRMAVAVPKRLFKRAVMRNLLKRRIREAYRLLKGEAPSADILFVYTSGVAASFDEIREDVMLLLDKIGKQ